MKLLIVNNFAAGIGDGAIHDYLRMVAQDSDEHVVRYTDGTTNVVSLLHDARDFDAVVVAGGDGSVSAAAYELAYSGIPILPFPAGTANLLANNLMSPYEPHALARMTREMRTLDFDLGEIVVQERKMGFSIMAGAGYDATIMHDAQPSKKLLGSVAYFRAAFSNPMPQKSHIVVEVDGETFESEGLGVLLVNFSRIQFEIPLTHGTEPRDGMFDVVILKAENAFELIPALIGSIRDRDGEFPKRGDSLEIHTGSNVRVLADPPFQVQYDGEVPGLETPFEARVLPSAARFVVSGACIDKFGASD